MKIRPYSRIIVEGMDGSGKTTLVNQLVEYLGDRGELVPGYNRTPDPKSPMPQWWMEQLARNPVDKVVVHDRFFYPELVYGPLLRGRVNMDGPTRAYVQEFLRKYAFLIYCRPNIETLVQGFTVEPQMDGLQEAFHELLLSYDELMISEAPHYNGRFMRYDWKDDRAMMRLMSQLAGYFYS